MAPRSEVLSDAEVDFLLAEASNEHAPAEAAPQTVMMQGDLEQIHLADVLQTLATTKMEGTMRIRNPLEDRHVYCKDGRIRVHVPQRVLARRIGQRLVNAGVVTIETLRAVLIEQRKDKRPLGVLLVDGGHCAHDQIEALLEEQAAEDVYALFTWRHGAFELWKGAPQADTAKLFESCFEYDINSLLLEVARRSDEWETILAAIGSLDEVPQRTRETTDGTGLDPARAEMLRGVDGHTSYRELTERCATGMFAGARAARDLVKAGWLRNPDDEGLVAVAQRLADGGNGKRALMTIRTLIARPDDRSVDVVRAAADCLDIAGERKIASAMLLEAAQRQEDGETSLQMARRAKELDPHDVSTLSFLRTILLVHSPADSPELEKCTLELLDALTTEGRTGTALEIVEDARRTHTMRPAILLREARARQKAKDIPGAVAVLKELAEHHDTLGETSQANSAYAHLLRLDRNRKDIAKLLKQRTRTRGERIARVGVAAAIGLGTIGVGMWFWSHFAALRSLEEARAEVGQLIAKRQFDDAVSRLAEWTAQLGDVDGITDLRTQLSFAKAQESSRRHKQRNEELVAELARAAEALEGGKVDEAVKVYQRLAAAEDRRAATIEAADRRLRAFTVRLGDIARNLQQQALPLPEQLIDRNDLVAAQAKLAKTVDTSWIQAFKEFEAVVAGKDELAYLPADLQKHLAQSEGAMRESFRKAETLTAAYDAAMARNEQQRRLDPLFQRAVQREAVNDFVGALADYSELEQHSSADNSLLKHFRERIARLRAITELLDQQVAASKAGDFDTAKRHLRSLCYTFPEIGFERIVRLPLRIETRPLGARVRLDGADAGVTPVLLQRSPATASEVRVELAGFAGANISVSGDDKAALSFDLRLQPESARKLASAVETPPVATAAGVLVVDRAGTVAMMGKDGVPLWSRRTEDLSGFLTRPVIVGSRAIIGSVDGDLRAVDLATGAIAWTAADLPMDLAPKAVAGGLVAATTSGAVVFLGDDGKVQRRFAADDSIAGFWTDADGGVTTLSGKGQLRRHAADGKRTLDRRIGDAEVLGFAQDAGDLIVGTDRGRLASISLASGATNWDVELGGEPLGTPIVVGDHVWQALRSGLTKLQRSNGAKVAASQATEGEHVGAVVRHGQRLIVPSATGPMVHSLETGEVQYRLEGSKKARVLATADEIWVIEPDHAISVYRNLR
jgi:hypothetical protein